MIKERQLFCGFVLMVFLAVISSCTKDTDGLNWSPTQALPPDTTDQNTPNPIDTNQTTSTPFDWQAIIIGDDSFYGDSATFEYSFDTTAAMHQFSCFDNLGRQIILRVADLNNGDHPISFSNTTSISFVDGDYVYDTSFNPNGYINIFNSNNGIVSALFESDLTDIGGTGQIKEIVNGSMVNAIVE